MQKITNNAAYFRLTEQQRKLYDSGLPAKMMGLELRKMSFQAYSRATGMTTELTSATKQLQNLIRICNTVDIGTDISATWVFHSHSSDEAAFGAAACVYEALFPKFSGAVLAADETHNVHPGEGVHLIHGITPDMRDGDLAGVRSFLRKHSSSLNLLVASVLQDDPVGTALDDLVHRKLRVHVDNVFALTSTITTINTQRVMEV